MRRSARPTIQGRFHRLVVCLCAGAVLCGAGGCGDDDAECGALPVQVFDEGILLADDCGDVSLTLLPAAKVDGAWRGAGRDGACVADGETITCPIGDAGEVRATVAGEIVSLELVASRDATVQGLALEGGGGLAGATGWLSNGFQSWSQSGVLALGELPTEAATERALEERGDSESLRTGEALSYWHTFVGGGGPVLFAGATTAARFRPWAQVGRDGDDGNGVAVRLVSGASGEQVGVTSGETLSGESWWIEVGHDLTGAMSRYGRSLPSRRWEVEAAADVGWNSWYDLWDGVDEDAVRANAALAAEWLGPYAPEGQPLRIVVDDGWQVAWGEWEPNAKFPSGLDGLAADLAADGFELGVWLAPALVTEDSSLVADHPEWFLPEAVYNHSKNGRMRILDPTHPGAAAHITQFIGRIVSWGYRFLKIDFLFAATYESARYEAVTGMEAYARFLEIIRSAAGEDVVLLAVGAPSVPSFPFVDAWRVGADIAFEPIGPSWYFAVNQARSIAARWPDCLATLCDADPPILRELPEAEVTFGGWVVALSGGGLFLSDDLRELDDLSRVAWGVGDGRGAYAIGGLPAVPEDPFPAEPPVFLTNHAMDHLADENRHALPSRWRLSDDTRVGFNHGEAPLEVEGVVIPARGAAVLP
ncbi:MAG: alpha-galactosidase [bacterium]